MHQFPSPPDTRTASRWAENRRRRRIIESDWQDDLDKHIARKLGKLRAAVVGKGDTAHNAALSVVSQLSTLYDMPAKAMHESAEAVEVIETWLKDAGHWQILQGHMPCIVGQREGLVLSEVVLHPVSGRPKLLTRVCPADLVAVKAHPDNPDEPTWVAEYRPRQVEGEPQWVRYVYDIRDPMAPEFRIEDEEGRPLFPEEHVTGPAYLERWSYADGEPFIPGEWYHAKRTGRLTNHRYGAEVFDGSLESGAHWSHWSHIIFDASWPQRYGIGVRLVGASSREGDGQPYIDTDPSSLIIFEAEPGVSGSVGQFDPGGDPEVIGSALKRYTDTLAQYLGISPTDIERASGDARSGYALELTNEGKRKAQRQFAMSFERHDSALLGKIAAMLRNSNVATLPDRGWSVDYHGIPLSLTERSQQLDELTTLVESRLISRVRALARHEGMPLEAARKQLEEDQADINRFS